MDSQDYPTNLHNATKCRATINSLSQYIDGGLTSDEFHMVADHLSQCTPCESVRAEIEQIRIAARELPQHTPAPVLWTRIQAEIESEIVSDRSFNRIPEHPQSWWQRLFGIKVSLNLPQLAAATALVALLAGYSASILRTNGAGPGRISPSAISAQIADEPILLAEVNAKLNEYNTRKVHLDPSIRNDFESVLKGIDSSIQGCQREIRANPTSIEQQVMYRSLYEEKIRLIDDMNRLAR
jgi:hypothetical protein